MDTTETSALKLPRERHRLAYRCAAAMKNTVLLSALCFACFACSPALVIDEGPKVTQQRDIICKKETPIGSNYPIKRCTTAAQREEERKHAGDVTGNTGNNPPTER